MNHNFSNSIISKNNQSAKVHIHILGIAGIGMSGIARLFDSLGYHVTGSDLVSNASTQDLESLGIRCFKGHSAKNLIEVIKQNNTTAEKFALVCSSAIDINDESKNGNEELRYVKANKLNLYSRAEALSQIARELNTIAVSGTHGKTTTTSLVNVIFSQAGLDPSFLIGGLPRNIGKNAYLGKSKWFVLEADESDKTFLYVQSHIAIITNIDHDHLENYDDDFEKLKQSFIQFVRNIGIGDYAVVCTEDLNVKSLISQMHRNLITYGFSADCTIYASQIEQNQKLNQFRVISEKFNLDTIFTIQLPGKHNVLNSLAAISSAKLAGIKTRVIQKALSGFVGVTRRFESLGFIRLAGHNKNRNDDKNQDLVEVIDDYAHHPEEIIHTLKAARACYKNNRLVAVFQAHRYSRTYALLERFSHALVLCDELIFLPIFSAGEINHQNIHNQDMIDLIIKIKPSIKVSQIFADEFNHLSLEKRAQFLKNRLKSKLKNNDVVVCMGAGSIRTIIETALKNEPKN